MDEDPICNIDDDDLNFDLDDTFNTKKIVPSEEPSKKPQQEKILINLFGPDVDNELDELNKNNNTNANKLVSSTQQSNFNSNESTKEANRQTGLLNLFQNEHEYSNIEKNTTKSVIIDSQDLTSLWSFAKQDLLNQIENINLHTLKFYLRQIVKTSLSTKNDILKIQNIPFLNVYIKQISNRSNVLTVTLADDSGCLEGVLSENLVKNFNEYLRIGSVLILYDVRLMKGNSGYFLNIIDKNLASIYYQLNDELKKLEAKIVHRNNLNDYKKSFFESLSEKEESIRRPVPQIQQNKASSNTSTIRVNPTAAATAPLKRKITEIENTPDKNEVSNNKRKFQFSKKSQQETLPNETQNSDELFSQLIFGIEDELFKDD